MVKSKKKSPYSNRQIKSAIEEYEKNLYKDRFEVEVTVENMKRTRNVVVTDVTIKVAGEVLYRDCEMEYHLDRIFSINKRLKNAS